MTFNPQAFRRKPSNSGSSAWSRATIALDRGQIGDESSARALLWHGIRGSASFAGLLAYLLFSGFFFNCAGCASAAPESPDPTVDRSGTPALFEPGDDELLQKEEASAGARQVPASRDPGSRWSIALATLSGVDHQAVARSLCDQIRTRYPELQPIFSGTLSRGRSSAVFVGRYDSPSSPASRAMMERIGALKLANGALAFPRAMPAQPDVAEARSPLSLDSLRSQYRLGRIVYSLKVAEWGTFGDTSIDYPTCMDRAEAMARALRAQGLSAWFDHNHARELSVVSVGVFGSDAYDSRSTLYAPEVEVLMERFEVLLINGEPILNPQTGRPMTPILIEVPN